MKSNHLCFRCGEKYGHGHICKKRQLSCLMGAVESKAELDHSVVGEEESEIMIEGVLE